MDESLRLLLDVLSIPSVNGIDDEGKVAEYLAAYFHKAGIEAEVLRDDPKHANILAYIPGKKDETPVLWNGHLDTVPYGSLDEWKTDPAVPTFVDGKIYCRGASDMKSGLCAMVYALCESRRKGIVPEVPILFAGTYNEENGGSGARAIRSRIEEQDIRRMLIGEPTDLKIGSTEKGCLWLKLTVHGKTCHAAYAEQGSSAVSALFETAELLKSDLTQHTDPLLGRTSVSITKIEGGTAPNMIPDLCSCLIDCRYTPDLTPTDVEKKIDLAVRMVEERHSGEIQTDWKILVNRKAVGNRPDDPLKTQLAAALEQEGLIAEEAGIHFCTDASVFAEHMDDASVFLFGPGDPQLAHKSNEFVETEKYLKAVAVLEKLLRMSGVSSI